MFDRFEPDVEAFRVHLASPAASLGRRPLAITTQATRLGIIRGFHHWLRRRGLAIANPAKVHLPGRKADVPVNVLDITLARRELGWVPRTAWRDAILRTVEWMRYEPSVKALLDKGHHG